MTKRRFCVDCSNRVISQAPDSSPIYHCKVLPNDPDIVTGRASYTPCKEARREDGDCGLDGGLFQLYVRTGFWRGW